MIHGDERHWIIRHDRTGRIFQLTDGDGLRAYDKGGPAMFPDVQPTQLCEVSDRHVIWDDCAVQQHVDRALGAEHRGMAWQTYANGLDLAA